MVLLPSPLGGARLAYREVSELTIEVRENNDWRWLLFHSNTEQNFQSESFPIQSLMSKQRPEYLALPYMQAMMVSLCLNVFPANGKVLQLGLGGGAINRFLMHYYPEITLQTVELSSTVLDIYQQYFCAEQLPINRAGCAGDGMSTAADEAIVIHDAMNYFALDKSARLNDLVICDMYGAAGLPNFMQEKPFFVQLGAVLGDTGILVINAGAKNVNLLQKIFNSLREVFRYLLIAEVPGFENIILYASNSVLNTEASRIAKLQSVIDIDLVDYLSQAKSLSE